MYIEIYCDDNSARKKVAELLKLNEGKTSSKIETYKYEVIEPLLVEIHGNYFNKFLYSIKWIDDIVDCELRKNKQKFQIIISNDRSTVINDMDFENCVWINSSHSIEEFESFSLIKDSRKKDTNIEFEFNFYSKLEWSHAIDLKTLHGELKTQIVKSNELTFTLTWIGELPKDNLNVRIHHQCETSEIHDSIHCDCREQLRHFKQLQFKEKKHLLIYCHEEGRGAGIFNKINAYYNTQKFGDDTVDAFKRMGLKVEQRNFEIPADILFQLGIKSVIIWTNNPLKYKPVIARGIMTTRHDAWSDTSSKESKDYINSKIKKMGHIKDE